MPTLDLQTALKNWDELAGYGGIVRGKWQGEDAEGRRIACWLGALDASIDGVEKCPASIMPAWLAGLTPYMDDKTSAQRWPEFMRRYRRVLGKIDQLTAESSRRALLRTLEAALAIAEPHNPKPVQSVRALIAEELAGQHVTPDQWAAAEVAARDAAWDAWAAAWAAWDAAEAAAWAAAWAAWAAAGDAAEVAARDAAWDAWAAAGAAAGDQITDACLCALESELKLEAV